MNIPANIILSRTDGVGDMVLMLPMAGILKKNFPNTKIAILGKQYTKALVDACVYVDEFIDEVDFFSKDILIAGQKLDCIIHVRTNKAVAKRAVALKIKTRIGTSSRLYHWFTCNKLIPLKRKNSDLHEAQLNIKLLKPLGISEFYSLEALQDFVGLTRIEPLLADNYSLIKKEKYNLIIHPKSQGSSREWSIQNFIMLINILDEKRFTVFLTGVEKERDYIDQIIKETTRPVINLAGKLSLAQFISFIKNCDGIVANATGPLHMGGVLGINTFGLFPPLHPIHPGRWAPLGPKVKIFVLEKNCTDCKHRKDNCVCINAITPIWVKTEIERTAVAKINTSI
jgi:heptosyltransferase III